MAIVNVNGISGINSITAQGTSLNFYTAAGSNLPISAETLNVGTGASVSSPETNVLTLGTNNSERVRVDSSGNIGLGTNNPQQKLDVLGNILCNGFSGYALGASSGKYYHFDNLSGNNFIGLESTNTLGVYVGGNLGLRISSSGNIGIGSAVPVRLLDISQTNSTAYNADDFDQNYQVLRLRNATALRSVGIQFQVGTVGQAAITATETGDGSTALTFATRNGGVRSEKVRIAPNGWVGIGTTSLPSIVSIGSSRVSDNVVVTLDRNSTGGYWGGLLFKKSGNDSWAIYDDSSSPSDLRFRNGSGGIDYFVVRTSKISGYHSPINGMIAVSEQTLSLADDATVTIANSTNGVMLVMVYEVGSGSGGVWGSNYYGTTGIVYNGGSGYGGLYSTDTDGGICVYKSAFTHSTIIKNRTGATRNFSIAVYATQCNTV